MSDADLRIDPLTGAHVVVTPWRQQRPNLPEGLCPFCPGGLEAPRPYDVLDIPNRWPALPDGGHEVVLHSPDHDSSFSALGEDRSARVVELWSARTAALGSRDDVAYVFVFENRGRLIGSTIDHPHSQIMAFGMIPPIPKAELSASRCDLCQEPRDELIVACRSGWQAVVPWARVPTGIMDQIAAPLCRADHALLLDCRTGAGAAVPLNLAAVGLALLVIDTRARHDLTDGRYGARRRACEGAASMLGVRSL